MRRYFVIIPLVLLVLVACGGDGVNIGAPEYQPASLRLNDYDVLIGKEPVFRKHDFSTCPGRSPNDHYTDPTCGNHVSSVEVSFDHPWVVAGVGPFRAWKPIDPAQGGIGDKGCVKFEFTLEPLTGDSELALGVHPTVEAVVPSGEGALLSRFYSWGDTSEGIRMRHRGDGASRNCYHMLRARYAVGVHYDQITPSMRDGVVELGRVSDFVQSSDTLYVLQQGSIEIKSGKKILVGFSSVNPQSQTSTTDVNAFVYACLDEDEDGVCDFEKGVTCWNLGGDYLSDKCCGFDADVPVCDYYAPLMSYCANTTMGEYRWLSHDFPGMIVPVGGSCTMFDAVSNSSTYFVCGSNESVDHSRFLPEGSLTTITKGGETHHYACVDAKIRECGGDNPFSDVQSVALGDTIVLNNVTKYCSHQGTFTTTLDASKSACIAAGFDWTGTKCCGEPDDPLQTFDDFGINAEGVCLNNSFVPNGDSVNDSVLVYFGALVVCDPAAQLDFAVAAQDFVPGIRPLEHGVCGTYLANATPGQHAVCFPDAHWRLKSVSEYQFVKNISWPRQPGQTEQGCCATNECWTGSQCIRQGEYYQLGEVGYRCE